MSDFKFISKDTESQTSFLNETISDQVFLNKKDFMPTKTSIPMKNRIKLNFSNQNSMSKTFYNHQGTLKSEKSQNQYSTSSGTDMRDDNFMFAKNARSIYNSNH